ncbi:T9SS type A sorting domain-containing protein, partial [bacterium]|nr:T9SS type A sorting domain-containing protein [bacterium]
AEYGEMHLMGAPMHPNGIQGEFRVANPNTYPDGDWPYPGHTPDGINDYNGLDALPHIWRDWDLTTFDPQGNVDLTYDLEAQFEDPSGPVDPTSAISFDSPLTAGMALATIDSFFVYIDTSVLPGGEYEGIVRVFEDIPHPPGELSPNGYWDLDEVSDTFVLKFMLVLPDIDIDDDYAGLAGNEMYIEVEPGEVDVAIGEFRVYAAGEDTNVDDWDGPGTESILDLAYYDPNTDTLEKIPADGGEPISFLVFGPGGSSIEVLLDGTMGDTLILNGPSKLYRVSVADIDVDLPAGIYKTDQPESWEHGDGTVAIAARGLDTGMGWLDGESGPGMIYDPAIPAVSELMDYFHLTIEVGSLIDVEFDSETLDLAGDPGDQVCGSAVVNNIGNAEATDVHFEAGNLLGEDHFGTIPMSAVDFTPPSLVIPLDSNAATDVCVVIPLGTRADTYFGTVALLADGEEQFDELTLGVTVGCIPAMNVSATELPTVLIDHEGSKVFEVCNLGNCDLSGVAGTVSGLPAGLTAVVNINGTVAWDGCENGTVDYSVAPEFEAGTYVGSVEITAHGDLSGSFPVTVIVLEVIDLDFDPEYDGLIAEDGVAGGDVTLEITLVNMGNVGIDSGITFTMTDLVGDGMSSVIPAPTEFPEGLAVPYGGDAAFDLVIAIPAGLVGQDYTGTLQMLHDGAEMDVVDVTITLDRDTKYVTIFPNPVRLVNGDETITISLGDFDSVDAINVYDVFGGLVAEVELPGGGARASEVTWDLENDDGKLVATGMYVVTIEADDEVVTRKIMVIK